MTMRAIFVAMGVLAALACGCKKAEESAGVAATAAAPAETPEEVVARHFGAATAIFEEHLKTPKDGLVKLRQYGRDHLPELSAALARAVVEIDTLGSGSKRTARAKEMLKALEGPLKALQSAAEAFYAKAGADEDARELMSDIGESYDELGESLRASLEALGVGVAKPTSCERAYEMMTKCMPGFAMKEEAFLGDCERHEAEELSIAMLGCGKLKDCKEYEACITKVGESRAEAARVQRVKDGIERLTKQLAEKAWRDARASCEGLRPDLKDGSQEKQLCDGLPRQALTELTTALTALRDKGDEDKDLKCYELRDAAKAVSEDETKKAEVLCQEVAIGAKAGPAIAAAQKSLQASAAEIPFDCDFVLDMLEKIGSDFARTRAQDVARACYVDLGRAVLAAKVPAMQYVCDYQVQKVWDAAKKWSLQDADLAAWLEKAKPLCDKSAAPVPVEPAVPVPTDPPPATGEIDCAKVCQKQIDCAKAMGGMTDESAKQALEGCSLGCSMAVKSEESSLRKVYQGMAVCADKPCGLEWAQCLGEHMK